VVRECVARIGYDDKNPLKARADDPGNAAVDHFDLAFQAVQAAFVSGCPQRPRHDARPR
jgi:hypothetical protein